MELSIREAKSRFTEAVAAAARGERVVITKHGHPFVELISAQAPAGTDADRAAEIRQSLGLDGITVRIAADFDDPVFSQEVLGLRD